MELADHIPEGEGLDRLSSFPDEILTDILSRLPINSAATTSVLSHRWRHLWTRLTCFKFRTKPLLLPYRGQGHHHIAKTRNLTDFLSNILLQLTSPKLDVFEVEVAWTFEWFVCDHALESLIHDICCRNLQQFIFSNLDYGIVFPLPDCLLNCQSLVVLDLYGPFGYDYSKAVDIQLPNLKKLSLIHLTYLPQWLESFYMSSPLLEDLTLISALPFLQPLDTIPSVNIFFPNLKSLKLDLFPWRVLKDINPVSIDAPQLTNLVIYGCVLPYRFRSIPTALVKACIDSVRLCMNEYGYGVYCKNDLNHHQFSEIFKGISNTSDLELLVVKSSITIFTCLNVNQPMFFNIVRLKVTLYLFGLDGCEDLLASLQCFPNLEHLWVTHNKHNIFELRMEQRNWRAPNIVPSCLISKLKTIKITGVEENDGGLELLRYILANAKVLKELYLKDCVKEYSEEAELKFGRYLYKLPKSSLTCEVVFSGNCVTLSSNVSENRKLNVKWHRLLVDNLFSCYSPKKPTLKKFKIEGTD